MTCSPSNFPRGKKVGLNGTGTELYADQCANIIPRCKFRIHKQQLYTHMHLVIQYITATTKQRKFACFM